MMFHVFALLLRFIVREVILTFFILVVSASIFEIEISDAGRKRCCCAGTATAGGFVAYHRGRIISLDMLICMVNCS